MEKRWKKRPEGSNWGDFGENDQLGCLNYITPDKVLAGIREISEGISFCLSLPLDYPGGNNLNPNRNPPILRPTIRAGMVNYNCIMDDIEKGRTDVLSDDLAILHLQYSTQWDALSHVGSMFDLHDNGKPEAVYYNGYSANEFFPSTSLIEECGIPTRIVSKSSSQALVLGVETMAEKAVQGRAVMVDLFAHYGEKKTLIGYKELMKVIEIDKLIIEKGDILCFHTGFAECLLNMNKKPDKDILHNYGALLDGRDTKLLQWLTDSKISAIAADNYAVEAYPARDGGNCCSMLPLHEHCLFKIGLPLGELWRLTPLAKWLRENKRTGFFLTAPPLNLPGAVASPLTPVGTV